MNEGIRITGKIRHENQGLKPNLLIVSSYTAAPFMQNIYENQGLGLKGSEYSRPSKTPDDPGHSSLFRCSDRIYGYIAVFMTLRIQVNPSDLA
jgi:hypothetical protein